MEWRLLIDGAAAGAWNMAVDESLAEAVHSGASPPVVRFYRWNPPCLSLGASQPPGVVDEAFCTAEGVDIVRRPTGGRAVLHHLELTYSVAARLGRDPFTHDLQAVYQNICRALVLGLRRLGVPAEVAGSAAGTPVRPTEAIPCFVGPAAGEVVVGGRKLVGSAMRRVGDSILQHGAILQGWDARLQAGCLGLADDASLRSAVVTLADLHIAQAGSEAVIKALAGGFAEHFGVAFTPSCLAAAEEARARVLERGRYGHLSWTVARERPRGA